MTTIMTVVPEGTTVDTFAAALAEGKVKFYRVRENDTMRHIPFLAEGTKDREIGEWVLEQREEGVTMKALAKDLLMSVPSVRRLINATLLAQEVEEYDEDDIAEILEDAAVEPGETTEASNDKEEAPVVEAKVVVSATSDEVFAVLGLDKATEEA